MPFEIIYSGYDGLDLSYRTFLPDHVLGILRSAKSEASKSHSSVAVNLGGKECVVSGSGAFGGYQFNVDTGLLGETWLIKEAERSDPWGCRVSIKSLPLALFGAEEMKRRCDIFLAELGVHLRPTDCRVSRIDFAIDMLIPEFELNPSNFVCHSKSKKTDYRQMETTRSGDVISGVRIGKMPNLQLAVYDKRQDVIAKKKDYWWSIWSQRAGREITRDQTVWRFELRAGRNAIDSYYNCTSWELISHCFGNLLSNIASRIRMICPQSDTNRSRWPDDPIWSACRALIADIPPHSTTIMNPRAILEKLENERRFTLEDQHFGLETTLAASLGYSADDYDEFLLELSKIRKQRIESLGEVFERKMTNKRSLWQAKFG
ncbi:MAG: hypothetical protein RH945_02435 [Hyphomonas sp.]